MKKKFLLALSLLLPVLGIRANQTSLKSVQKALSGDQQTCANTHPFVAPDDIIPASFDEKEDGSGLYKYHVEMPLQTFESVITTDYKRYQAACYDQHEKLFEETKSLYNRLNEYHAKLSKDIKAIQAYKDRNETATSSVVLQHSQESLKAMYETQIKEVLAVLADVQGKIESVVKDCKVVVEKENDAMPEKFERTMRFFQAFVEKNLGWLGAVEFEKDGTPKKVEYLEYKSNGHFELKKDHIKTVRTKIDERAKNLVFSAENLEGKLYGKNALERVIKCLLLLKDFYTLPPKGVVGVVRDADGVLRKIDEQIELATKKYPIVQVPELLKMQNAFALLRVRAQFPREFTDLLEKVKIKAAEIENLYCENLGKIDLVYSKDLSGKNPENQVNAFRKFVSDTLPTYFNFIEENNQKDL